MKQFCIPFALAFFNLVSGYLYGQINHYPVNVTNYTAEEYHSNLQNWGVTQDARGVMYFANYNCVLEYDGINWRKIYLPCAGINSIASDKNGIIYVGGTDEFGFLQANDFGELVYKSLSRKLDSTVSISEIKKIISANNSVYFLSNESLIEYNYSDLKVNILPSEIKLDRHAFLVDDTVYVSNKFDNLYKLTDKGFVPLGLQELCNDKYVRAVFKTDKDKLLICTYKHGLYQLDIHTNELTHSVFSGKLQQLLKKSLLYCAGQIENRYLVFGTLLNGIIITNISGEIIQIYSKKTGLNSNQIVDIYANKHLWLATLDGISKIDIYSPISSFDSKFGLEGQVTSICKLGKTVFVGSLTGVYKLNYSKYNEPEFIKISSIRSSTDLKLINGEELLACNNRGVFKIVNGRAINLKVDGMDYLKPTLCITQSEIDSSIFYFGGRNLLTKLKLNRNIFKIINEYEVGHSIRRIREDELGSLWLETQNGVINFDVLSGKFKKVSFDNDLNKNVIGVNKINNQVVFSTKNGLYEKVSDGNFKRLDSINKYIPNDFLGVFNVFELQKDELWLGLYNDDYQEKAGRFIKNKSGGYILDSFLFNNLTMNMFTSTFFDGTSVWVGTGKGLINYRTDLERQENRAEVILRRITLNNDSVIYDGNSFIENKELRIPLIDKQLIRKSEITYTHNTIEFEYVSPFYLSPKSTYYSYRLNGLNNSWSNWETTSKIKFAYLKEGSYIFHVKSKNSLGYESPVTSYYFVISKPWHRSYLAYVLYLLVFMLIILTIIKVYTQRLRLKNKNLETIVKKRTFELEEKNILLGRQKREIQAQKEYIEIQHDKIRKELENTIVRSEKLKNEKLSFQFKALANQINPHFIFNTLNSVQNFIIQNNIESSNSYLAKFARLMRCILENSQHEFVNLGNELEALTMYIDLEQLRLNNKFEYTISVDNEIDDSFVQIPPLLIQPFVENAIIHGIRHKKGKGHLNINFKLEEDILICTIEDNGVGRKKSTEINKMIRRDHESVATKILFKRIEIINEIYTKELKLEVNDLFQNETPAGTRVIIKLPCIT